jgi:hypothetical protein
MSGFIEQVLQQTIDLERLIRDKGVKTHRVINVPNCLCGEVLDLQSKFKDQFGIDVIRPDPKSFELELRWTKESIQIGSISAFINFKNSRNSFKRLDSIIHQILPEPRMRK